MFLVFPQEIFVFAYQKPKKGNRETSYKELPKKILSVRSNIIYPVIGLVSLGLGNLFLQFPDLQFYMKILCFFYLLYLSWTIIGSFSLIKNIYGTVLGGRLKFHPKRYYFSWFIQKNF